MNITSPEHDVIVALILQQNRTALVAPTDTARAACTVVRLALTAALRRIDAERFTVEPADTTQWWVIDRWNDGWICDTHTEPRGAEIAANRLNTRNIRDGQQHLREQVLAATRAAA